MVSFHPISTLVKFFHSFEVRSKFFKKKVFDFLMRVVGNLSTQAEYEVSQDFIFSRKSNFFYFH